MENLPYHNTYNTLSERGFISQVTDEAQVRSLLKKPTTCYVGFDPTAASFHVGNLLPIMALMQMQRAGHRPIALIGGGTGLIGDPSGKTEARYILSREEIYRNIGELREQLLRVLNFGKERPVIVNNADWLVELDYIEFLRDIGCHFSVNRMLTAESYRSRFEQNQNLSFTEFNYMLLQAYDFWYLFRHWGCRLQLGGNDQWGNILAGIELIRKLGDGIAQGLTLPLLTTSTGAKMGKTHEGTMWLDPRLTSPYEYYQYWINQDDRDIPRFLALFTFLPMEEVGRLSALEGADIRQAKEALAFEATMICHGIEEARLAQKTSRALFRGNGTENQPTEWETTEFTYSGPALPECRVSMEQVKEGIPAYILFHQAGLCKSLSKARKLISQGGGYIESRRIEQFDRRIGVEDFNRGGGSVLLRAGKKRYARVEIYGNEM